MKPRPIAMRRAGRRRIRILASLVTALLLAGLISAAPANAALVAGYRVTVSGTVSGTPFAIAGSVALGTTITQATTNGVNPYEVCLQAGNPVGSPQAGAIKYGSNSGCFSSRGSNIDLVFASASGSTYIAQPDGRLQATFLNSWTDRTSIASCIYSPISGSAQYTLTSTGISGRILMKGYGGASCQYSTYNATITGVRIA